MKKVSPLLDKEGNARPERWKKLPGADGYFVSDLGRVIGKDGEWPQYVVKNGELCLWVDVNEGRTLRSMRFVVLWAWYLDWDWAMEWTFLDGDTSNFELENLEFWIRTGHGRSLKVGRRPFMWAEMASGKRKFDLRLAKNVRKDEK